MDQDIMKENIKNPICRNSESNIHQQMNGGEEAARNDQNDCRDAENNGKKIIFFQNALSVGMVGPMPRPQKTVHNVFMGKPRHKFHEQECSDHNHYFNNGHQH